ncbi:hypothetical protein IVG45_09325 [Methylomonas sp. LL1]|uniref:hypothetical protein n=1 Tax=Methylomonas sp. LL1 TaxID=2785785 RepID=UPI0018C3F758|nr:hypothetical protein [Methylomonas sp. LL1]QPK65109.1 hypothetical protein IVG45_09325 [Methylomonas sp. LL1]
MTSLKKHTVKLASAGVLVFGSLAGLLAPASASAALVTGNATISIDNTAFSTATGGWTVNHFFDASYNETAINASTAGGTTSTTNMLFPVNTNITTTSYAGNRTLQATTMDSSDTATGQIGLSGALTMTGALGNLYPYDFKLQKFSGVWNLVSYDSAFKNTTFLQLTNAIESVNGSGQLSLSGDLVFGGGMSPTTASSIFGLTWSSFLGVQSINQNLVVGHLSLAPAAVPVPAAVWLFGSGLLGLLGVTRGKAKFSA